MTYLFKTVIIALQCYLFTGFAQVHFTFNSNTGNNATIAVPVDSDPNINGIPLAVGDEIGVFTPAGLCVGAIVWNNTNTSITVWGDDAQTTGIDGILPGEEMKFRLWQSSSNTEYDSVFAAYSFGDGIYNVNGIYILSELTAYPTNSTGNLEKGDDTNQSLIISSSIYPNPFNSTTSYQIESNHTLTVNIVLSDILGREIFRINEKKIFEGINKISLSLNELPSGIYFIAAQIVHKNDNKILDDSTPKFLLNKIILIK